MPVQPERLKLMVDRIENRALGEYYDYAYRVALEGAIARALLSSLAFNSAVRESNLNWIAFLPDAPEAAECYMQLDIGAEIGPEWEPVQEPVPEGLVAQLPQRHPSRAVGRRRLPINELPPETQRWGLFEKCRVLHAFPTGDDVVPRLDRILGGWIVLGDPLTDRPEYHPISSAVEREARRMRDRLRLVFAAEPITLRMVSALDRRYQVQLLNTLEASGLDEFLSAASSGTAPPVRIQIPPVTKTVSSMPTGSDLERWYARNRDELRMRVGELARRSRPGATGRVEMAREFDKPMQHDRGSFLGLVDADDALIAVFDVIGDAADIHDLLARSIRGELKKNNVLVVCGCAPAVADIIERDVVPRWRGVVDIAPLRL